MQDLVGFSRYIFKIFVRLLFETASFLLDLLVRPNRSRIPPIDDEILLKPAIKLSEEIKSGKLTSERVVETYIRRIRIVNPYVNAVVDEQFDTALKRAKELDKLLANNGFTDEVLRQMPLFGVPITIKETIPLKGCSITGGLPRRASKKAAESNPAVEKLIKAGAIPIGLTNIPCMTMWYNTHNYLYGQTNNPYDLSRIPGGSTGGEAAILAAAGSVIGIGSDLAGSIRIPSNFCGIFGHKSTPHTVSVEGIYPVVRKEFEIMLSAGPMTRYADDLLPMLKVMVDDNEQAEKLRLDQPVDLSKIKVYYCEEIGDPLASKCDLDILMGLRAAAEHFKSQFHVEARKVTIDEFKYGMAMWSAEFEGGRIYVPEHPDGVTSFDPVCEIFRCLVGQSEFSFNAIASRILEKLGSKRGTAKHQYLTGKAGVLRKRFKELIGDDGVLLMPTHPQPAPNHLSTLFRVLNCSYTAVGNILHGPITQCPLGMSREGLPFGVQVLASPYNDRLTLAVAGELGKAFGGWIPPSRVSVSGSC